MGSKFFFSLNSLKSEEFPGGTVVNLTSDQTPGFQNISFTGVKLKKGGFIGPIWHPNAQKLAYCIKGSCAVTMRTPHSLESYTVKEGDMFFLPKGYVHAIENTFDGETIVKFAYNHIKPETMYLSKAMNSLSDEVFTATFDTPASFYEGLKKNQKSSFVGTLSDQKKAPNNGANKYKFNVKDSAKPVLTKGGYLQIATKTNLPTLEGLGLLRFGLNPGGVVEPHWHTNAGELVYIVKGETKITILSPDGKVEVLSVKGGEGAFAPASYFHNIQNVGKDEVEVLAFFSDAEPDYIGLGESVGAFSNEVLAAIFNVKPEYFSAFKKPNDALIIVPLS